MVMIGFLLRLLFYVAATNALYIWEPRHVDVPWRAPERKSVDSSAGASRSQPLSLAIHHRADPVSSRKGLLLLGPSSASKTNMA